MAFKKLMIANRGEIAVRISRAAQDLGIATAAVVAEDDRDCLHASVVDETHLLVGRGARAYLDAEQVIRAARHAGCDAIHPGYGFLSESAAFARACEQQDLRFVGPCAGVLETFGDKTQARALAERLGVPTPEGAAQATELSGVREFLERLGPGGAVMIKALAGGGGRGMRIVSDAADLEEAYRRCRSEAKAAFGRDEVYVERLIGRARHIEVQVVGDGSGTVVDLGERDCTLQRRRQKLIEIAPSPHLSQGLRERIIASALRLAREVRYGSLGTFEFLVDLDAREEATAFAFIEANPRIQVEHTVTEEVTGIDLVQVQLRLSMGETLADVGLAEPPRRRGYAIQLRINMETLDSSGEAHPSLGVLKAFSPPCGPGVRVDTHGYPGYAPSPSYDSLLAKLIVRSPAPAFGQVLTRARRALAELRVEGVSTNAALLEALLARPELESGDIHTRFVEAHAAELTPNAHSGAIAGIPETGGAAANAAVTPVGGRLVDLPVAVGDLIREGMTVAVIEAMKMEHVVLAPVSGRLVRVEAAVGELVERGRAVALIAPAEVEDGPEEVIGDDDLDHIRPDLAEVLERRRLTLDEGRPDAVARRRSRHKRTARENLTRLFDGGEFTEYGGLALAAQRRRRSLDDLIRLSPADGLVCGAGAVNGHLFDDAAARCIGMAYDFTVFAGTQGFHNHRKMDRMLDLAGEWRAPVVIYAEGGGGRPGDTDQSQPHGLDTITFARWGRLKGVAPRLAVVSGRCFAGNAALAGASDLIIATRDSNLGMGGPAMIEGGGLGTFSPEQIGPADIQSENGVIDLLVDDEDAATAAVRTCLGYFQGRHVDWACADQRRLRRMIPENRLRAYDIREVIQTVADEHSVIELRRAFATSIITAFVRVEGRPAGLIANNPSQLGGAIDASAADKAAQFLELCGQFRLPLISLVDTPGFMVGPDVEKTGQVRRASRLFAAAAALPAPVLAIVLRKGYGLGAQAMTGGSFVSSGFTIAWPTGEFGGMGLEGGVRLGYRKELEAIVDPEARKQLFDELVAQAYARGTALNMASALEIDAVIDPQETRSWIVRGLHMSSKS